MNLATTLYYDAVAVIKPIDCTWGQVREVLKGLYIVFKVINGRKEDDTTKQLLKYIKRTPNIDCLQELNPAKWERTSKTIFYLIELNRKLIKKTYLTITDKQIEWMKRYGTRMIFRKQEEIRLREEKYRMDEFNTIKEKMPSLVDHRYVQ
jgi:hypothetical protein